MGIDFPAPALEPELRTLWHLAFGDSESVIDSFFSTAYSPERCRCVNADGQAAAALYWFDTECAGQRLAYLYAVATHPDFRRRGFCRALMADTQVLLTRLGYDGVLLVPAEPSLRQMYRRMGYRDCSTVSQFACAAGKPVSLKRLTAEEFAALRRTYLPQGGVVQEGESLAYLLSFAAFYAGQDFLLTASTENGQLWGMELLGNRDAAPGILASLGYSTGTFRAPGTDLPFAMFLPLKENAAPPAYFGLEMN